MVNTFVAGQFAIAAQQHNEQMSMKEQAINMAGGQDAFDNLYKWAASSYTEAQQAALNDRLAQPGTYQGAIKEMMFDYQEANGTTGSKRLAGATEGLSHKLKDSRTQAKCVRPSRRSESRDTWTKSHRQESHAHPSTSSKELTDDNHLAHPGSP